jgi:hypothetical protein
MGSWVRIPPGSPTKSRAYGKSSLGQKARVSTGSASTQPRRCAISRPRSVNIPRQSRGLQEVSRSKRLSQAPSLPYFRGLSRLPRTKHSNSQTPFYLWRFARYCGYCRGVLVFVPVHRETPFRVRGGLRVGSFIDGRPPYMSNFCCHPGRAGGPLLEVSWHVVLLDRLLDRRRLIGLIVYYPHQLGRRPLEVVDGPRVSLLGRLLGHDLRYNSACPLPRPGDDAGEHARERRAFAVGHLPPVPPRGRNQCRRVRRCDLDPGLRAAHGLPILRGHRRGREAELGRTVPAGEPDRDAVEQLKNEVGRNSAFRRQAQGRHFIARKIGRSLPPTGL